MVQKSHNRATKESVQLIFDRRKKKYSREDLSALTGLCESQVTMIASAGKKLKEGDIEAALSLLKSDNAAKITNFMYNKISWICEAVGVETPSREKLESVLRNIKGDNAEQHDSADATDGDQIAEQILLTWNEPETARATEEYNCKHSTEEEKIVEQLVRISEGLENIGIMLRKIWLAL